MYIIRKQTARLYTLAALTIFGVLPLLAIYSTHQQMSDFRTKIQPGMSVADLIRFAGKPRKIVHQGESLGLVSHSFRQPSLDAHTAMYAYPKEGVPYYNVFVFVDERRGVVSSAVVEKL